MYDLYCLVECEAFLPRENYCTHSDAKSQNDKNNDFSNADQNSSREDQSIKNVNHPDKSPNTINQTSMTTNRASQMTTTDHSICDTMKHNTKWNQNRENVGGQKDDACEDLFNVFLHAENHKIRQETRSPTLSASADDSDQFLSLPSVSACFSLVNPAGQSSLTTHVVCGQIGISDIPHFVSPIRGGSKKLLNILKAVPKMCQHQPKAVQLSQVNTELFVYRRELVSPPNMRGQATLPPYSFIHSFYPRFPWGFQYSPLHPVHALMGLNSWNHGRKVPGPPEAKGNPCEGEQKVSQSSTEGSQGAGEQEGEGDSGGSSAASGSGGASGGGGGGGDDRKDDRSSANSNYEEEEDEEVEEEDEEQQEPDNEACDSGLGMYNDSQFADAMAVVNDVCPSQWCLQSQRPRQPQSSAVGYTALPRLPPVDMPALIAFSSLNSVSATHQSPYSEPHSAPDSSHAVPSSLSADSAITQVADFNELVTGLSQHATLPLPHDNPPSDPITEEMGSDLPSVDLNQLVLFQWPATPENNPRDLQDNEQPS